MSKIEYLANEDHPKLSLTNSVNRNSLNLQDLQRGDNNNGSKLERTKQSLKLINRKVSLYNGGGSSSRRNKQTELFKESSSKKLIRELLDTT